MGENITKRQHYVPQFYLRNFANKENHVWVYDRKKQRIFQSPPRAICQEDDLYEVKWKNVDPCLGKYVLRNRIENMLREKEGIYQNVVHEIISRCNEPQNRYALICDTNQKVILSNFIANLITRNPYLLDDGWKVRSDLPQIQETQRVFTELGLGSVQSLVKLTEREIMLDDSVDTSDTSALARAIRQLDFAFSVSKSETFVTSSFPVHYGTFQEASVLDCLFIPLCPQIAVMYLPRTIKMKYRNRIFLLDDSMVIGANELYLSIKSEQTRFIISHSKQNVERLKQRDTHIEKRR